MTLTNQEKILREIREERKRQDRKYGEQPRSMTPSFYIPILGEEFGEVCRAAIEGDSKNYRTELIELAAVAVAAVEDYDGGQPLYTLETVCPPIEYQIF